MVELIITVAVGAILLTIGIPSFRYVTNSNRIAAEINGLLGDLQFARSEAIKEGASVSVCVSSNGTACTGTNFWQNGWIVISSAANVGVLRVQAKFSSTDTFVATQAVSTITFNRDGYANGIANGTLIALHDSTNNHNWTRCLAITLSGLIASQTYGTTTNTYQCL